MRIPPLRIKIMLELNPLKSTMLVGRLAVLIEMPTFFATVHAGTLTPTRRNSDVIGCSPLISTASMGLPQAAQSVNIIISSMIIIINIIIS